MDKNLWVLCKTKQKQEEILKEFPNFKVDLRDIIMDSPLVIDFDKKYIYRQNGASICYAHHASGGKKYEVKDALEIIRKRKSMKYEYVTSESVNIGHPDKTCDVIADAFLDEALRQDKNSQMAVECAIKNDKLFIYGEATTTAKIDYEKIARDILKEIGYKNEFKIIKEISVQSPDINRAVCKDELCANDQGIVFGYATDETKEFMPLPILIAHKLMQRYEVFRKGNNNFFADAKSQVTVKYLDGHIESIDKVLISVSHSEKVDYDYMKTQIMENVIDKVLAEYKLFVNEDTKYIINPSGKFTIWGSFGDSGCVGRKIVVDTYGGVGKVGGGCFSSKNATKVDRSGAYYARYVAKNIVANGLAKKCELQVSYGIGISEPLSINIDCFGTNVVSLEEIKLFIDGNFNFSVGNIIKELDLLRPIYKDTACYGHFGRECFPWEYIKNHLAK